jgi:hypothetical protein
MGVKAGYIYVLTHPSETDLIKVGMTIRSPEVRLKEHNTQFDKAAGKVVKETGLEWSIKEYFEVEDTYNAENAFFQRPPLTEIPGALGNELIRLDEEFVTWDWVAAGLEAASKVGIRKDTSEPPTPKPKPYRGAKWIESQLDGTGLTPIKGCGNGITKVWFKCTNGHIFKISK